MTLFSRSHRGEVSLNFDQLNALCRKPELFEPSEYCVWKEPHVSVKMLETHLDPKIGAASRKLEVVQAEADFIVSLLKLNRSSKILDLGCGPGLYCEEFCNKGLNVTGIDFCKNTIQYALQQAKKKHLRINYIHQDYLEMKYKDEFDAVTLIFYDFCMLSHERRNLLLKKVYQALKPGGYFVFDVLTEEHFSPLGIKKSWHVGNKDGFWSPDQHLVLVRNVEYPEANVHLIQYMIVESSGAIKNYYTWHHYYSLDNIVSLLGEYRFQMKHYFANLAGDPYDEDEECIGFFAQKKE